MLGGWQIVLACACYLGLHQLLYGGWTVYATQEEVQEISELVVGSAVGVIA